MSCWRKSVGSGSWSHRAKWRSFRKGCSGHCFDKRWNKRKQNFEQIFKDLRALFVKDSRFVCTVDHDFRLIASVVQCCGWNWVLWGRTNDFVAPSIFYILYFDVFVAFMCFVFLQVSCVVKGDVGSKVNFWVLENSSSFCWLCHMLISFNGFLRFIPSVEIKITLTGNF